MMARNRLADYTGCWPVPSVKSPNGAGKAPGGKSHGRNGARPRYDKGPALRILSATFGFFRNRKLWLMFFAAFHIAAAPGFAQVSKEYQLKAVFLWRLAQFTEWPATAFEHADSPIVICVLGENPFGDALDEAVRGETAHGRKFLTQYQRSIEQGRTCHILYLTGAGPHQAMTL